MIRTTQPQGGTHLPGIAILAALLSVGVVAVGATVDRDRHSDLAGVGPTRELSTGDALASAESEMGRVLEQPTLASELQLPDTLAVLKAHFGDQWPAASDELAADGFDQADLPPLLPWEQAEPLHRFSMRTSGEFSRDVFYRRLMKWPGREYSTDVIVPDGTNATLTPASLARVTGERQLAQVDAAAIERIDMDMHASNDELDRVIHKYMDALDEALQFEFDSGGFSKAPFQRPAWDEFAGEIYSKTASAGGWKSRISITRERYPYAADLKAEIQLLQAARRTSLSVMVNALEKS